jgi:uncharacterized coiled-coil DUF342 family protein
MALETPTIQRFTLLKQKRDTLTNQLSTFQGKLESAKDHYNSIIIELKAYGIGSLDELNSEIEKLQAQINQGLDEAEQTLKAMETELNALDGKEASSTVISR